uniref:Uncharacterized protein n=1 Tax=Anguilla anguilla TaxID=7936 RepID=A0A0E9SU46_ANGAN
MRGSNTQWWKIQVEKV